MIIDEDNNNIFIIEKLNDLKKELDKDTINLKNIKQDISEFRRFDNVANYEYLNNLLDPKKKKGVKIPSNIPIPTCSFQMHNFTTFRPRTNGCDVFYMNPFFLASDSVQNMKLSFPIGDRYLALNAGLYFTSTDDKLDGTTAPVVFRSVRDFTQMIPDVYAKYRVVSACIEVRYIGQLDLASGVIGGGISYIKSNALATRFSTLPGEDAGGSVCNPDIENYGNFELIRDSYYHKENLCIEGIRMLYFPLDNSFNEFKKVFNSPNDIISLGMLREVSPFIRIKDDCFKSGFGWFVYTLNAPSVTDGRNLRLDYYINYECIPKAEFLNYMPVEINVNYISPELRKRFIEEVQEKSIQKIN